MFGSWATLVWSLTLLVVLWLVSRRLTFYGLSLLYVLTGNQNTAIGIYALLILPGTILHEASHWAMAKLVGVKTGKFSVLPKFTAQRTLQLGAVDVRGGRLWQHTLIGLAPLLAGSFFTLWIAIYLVDVKLLGAAWQAGRWQDVGAALVAGLKQANAALFIYLLFTISDAMFLSASDRAPVQRMVFYLAAVLFALYLLGLIPALPSRWEALVQNIFRLFAYGLGVALAVHLSLLLIFGACYYAVRILRK